MALLSLLLGIALTYEAIFRPNSFSDQSAALALTSAVVTAASFGSAVAGIALWWFDDGTRMISQPKEGPRHSLDP